MFHQCLQSYPSNEEQITQSKDYMIKTGILVYEKVNKSTDWQCHSDLLLICCFFSIIQSMQLKLGTGRSRKETENCGGFLFCISKYLHFFMIKNTNMNSCWELSSDERGMCDQLVFLILPHLIATLGLKLTFVSHSIMNSSAVCFHDYVFIF